MSAEASSGGNRTILFIAYHFPPSAAVGGQRIANFASAMRQFAWRPRVLTIPDEQVEALDRGRLKGLEDLPIEKAAVLPTIADAGNRLWSTLRGAGKASARPAAAARPAANASREPKARGGVRRFVLSLLALPDWQRGWCLPATLRALRVVRRERIDWILTSCPPYSVHLIGLAVKLATGRRWAADFRDPWMTTGSKRLYPTSGLSMRIERWLERLVVTHADLVLFNVDRLRNAYRSRYADLPGAKFVYIPNGIRDTRVAAPATKYDQFTICYTGSLYVGRSPEPVMQAIARLRDEGKLPARGIRLKLVGQCGTIDGVPTAAVVAKYGLQEFVDVEGPVPYAAAFEMVQRSHLALLLAPNLPYQIPAKFYDYLAAGTRMLAIAEEGGTADVLAETGAGRAFAAQDVDGIARFLSSEAVAPPAQDVVHAAQRFDVRQVTDELVRHLEGGAAVYAPTA